jgi:hypothetical protein
MGEPTFLEESARGAFGEKPESVTEERYLKKRAVQIKRH